MVCRRPIKMSCMVFRERGLKPPAIYEVRELQTALGLVTAEVGLAELLRTARPDSRDEFYATVLPQLECVTIGGYHRLP